jgi:hypothetical protein
MLTFVLRKPPDNGTLIFNGAGQVVGQNILTGGNSGSNITAASIGLGNVNNTSDLDKPISIATQAALTTLQNSISASNNPNIITLAVNSTISVHKVIYLDSLGFPKIADAFNIASVNVYGISLQSANAGGTIAIALAGSVIDPSWTFSTGRNVWLNANGNLSTISPINPAFYISLGLAKSSTELTVRIDSPMINA